VVNAVRVGFELNGGRCCRLDVVSVID
jgi:hypothetical protein